MLTGNTDTKAGGQFIWGL